MTSGAVFRSVGELEAAIGRPLGTSAWHPVSQDDVDGFADLTGDHQWIHVDPGRAAASAFGGTIAHGYLTLALLPGFAAQLYTIEAGTARLNYGVDRVRFPAPVPVGSRLRGSATITGVTRTPAGFQVAVRWNVECDRAEKPVCVAESRTLVLER